MARVADTLRERRALRREVRALSAQARASAAVVAVAPLGFAVVMAATDEATAAFLFGSPAGLACVVVGLGLELAGWRWMQHIVGAVQ
jgi:tight adherence protein B